MNGRYQLQFDKRSTPESIYFLHNVLFGRQKMSQRWSELKISVDDFFADCVKGRVELRSVSYRKAHDATGRGYIAVDGVTVWSMCSITYEIKENYRYRQKLDAGAPQGWETQKEVRKEMAAQGLYS